MALVEVDVDLGNVDTEDLCEEILLRIKRYKLTKSKGNSHSYSALESLKTAIADIALDLNALEALGLPSTSLEDQMKLEFLLNNWTKWSAAEMEQRLG